MDWLRTLTDAGVRDVRGQLLTKGSYIQRPLPGAVKYVVAHYVGSAPIPGQVGLAFCQATARYHVTSRGWPGIGYHLAIDVLGDIYLVGGLDTIRANVANKNELVVGVCIQGGGDGWVPSAMQRQAWYRLIPFVRQAVGNTLEIRGHRELQATQCPGNRYMEWLRPPVAAPPVATSYAVGPGNAAYIAAHPEQGAALGSSAFDANHNEYTETANGFVIWSAKRKTCRGIIWG